ncbi:hypothetical protein [Vibrio intestinalis]|uniref:hypothetical protein n=1 Tax=Vibrio intestinalis TaxID=2933291 RepID=UPI0021A6031B|nr:hypothetical protein [Vibrio intestinalis]
MKLALIVIALLSIVVATQTLGLYRSIAELVAFVCVAAAVILYRKHKRRKEVFEPEEL